MTTFNAESHQEFFSADPGRFKRRGLMGLGWSAAETGSKITQFTDARLDLRRTDEQEALALFSARNFRELVMKRPVVDSGPLHLVVWQNKKDRVLFIQLRKFLDRATYVPLTDVVEVTGAEYDAVFSRR